ncbi:MAG: AzlD domain-containing protein [Caldilineaceae bacterium]
MTQHEFFLILGMALVTFAVRYPVLALVSRMPLPDGLLRAMRFIPPAVLTAIVVPAVLIPDGQTVNTRYDNSYLIASLIAGVVAWQSKNLLLTIIVGMFAFGGWRWLMGAF